MSVIPFHFAPFHNDPKVLKVLKDFKDLKVPKDFKDAICRLAIFS